ncbi:MAG: 4Fe-4S binding protein [Candidatus Micrarchaeota archaeon]
MKLIPKMLDDVLKNILRLPDTVPYPAKKVEPPERFRGMIEVTDDCIACGACAIACPAKCIKFDRKSLEYWLPHCISCGRCADVCPVNAIKFTHNYEVVRRDKELYVKKAFEMLKCSVCGKEIMPLVQKKYMVNVKKLKPELFEKCPACKMKPEPQEQTQLKPDVVIEEKKEPQPEELTETEQREESKEPEVHEEQEEQEKHREEEKEPEKSQGESEGMELPGEPMEDEKTHVGPEETTAGEPQEAESHGGEKEPEEPKETEEEHEPSLSELSDGEVGGEEDSGADETNGDGHKDGGETTEDEKEESESTDEKEDDVTEEKDDEIGDIDVVEGSDENEPDHEEVFGGVEDIHDEHEFENGPPWVKHK